MLTLVTYDVNTESSGGKTRLRRVAKECVNYGQRVQNSVFECSLDYTQYIIFKNKLISIIDKEKDSLRFYNLGNHWENRVEHVGTKKSYNPDDVTIV